MKHPAEDAIDILVEEFLELRGPAVVSSVPGADTPATGTEKRGSGVTKDENFYRPDKSKTASGKYPPNMTGVVL
jgi:hypothetical protein